MLAALVAAAWAPLIRLDRAVGEDVAAYGAASSVVRRIAEFLDVVGAGGPATVVVLVAVALLWRHHRLFAAWLVASAVGTLVLRILVREAIDRARPVWPDAAPLPGTPAFPSGHASTGIAVWAVLGVVILLAERGLPARVVGTALIVGGVLMGPSRLILGVHWLSDVLGGWLLASGVALVAAAVLSARVRGRGGSAPPA